MRLVSFILFLLCLQATVFGQNKADYQWIFSLDQDTLPGMQSYMFDFNDRPFEVKIRTAGLEFNSNNASICDSDGNLLIYTNGCAIANGNHDVMPNGHDINEGIFFDAWWGGDCDQGYPGRQDIMILPSPSNQNDYYVIHRPIIYIPTEGPEKFIDEIRYSIVDLSLENGLGDVTDKNVVFYKDEKLLLSSFSAVLHENQKDWWIIHPAETGNTYYTFLLDSSGINLNQVQNIGPLFSHPDAGTGTSRFDPAGNHYSVFNAYHGLFLFDFDRATGLLSNDRSLEVETNSELSVIFGSLEWAAGGQYIYLAVHDRLYQVDSYEENLEDGLVLVDYWNGVLDPFATTFNMLARGPDCKIYICSNSSTLSYSVIKNPDNKGSDCNLVQQGIKLPYHSTVSSMPNFPNFRIDEEEICDPTISSIFGIPIEPIKNLSIYPNPSSSIINIKVPDDAKFRHWEIRDMYGKLILDGKSSYDPNMEVDCSNFRPGVYLFHFSGSDNNYTYRSKFIII